MSIEAYIRGKLPELRNWEDYLTSCVFESFKYLSVSRLSQLVNKLSTNIKNAHPKISFDEVKYYFWPTFQLSKYHRCSDTQPDVVIVTNKTALIVESKFHSSKSGIGIREVKSEDTSFKNEIRKEILDQLAREFLLGVELTKKHFSQIIPYDITDFYVLYITIDPILPKEDISESIKVLDECYSGEEINSRFTELKFYWLNWQSVASLMSRILKEDNKQECPIAQNLYNLLERLNLVPFKGFNFINKPEYESLGDEQKISLYRKIKTPYFKFLNKLSNDIFNDYSKLSYDIASKSYWHKLSGINIASLNDRFSKHNYKYHGLK